MSLVSMTGYGSARSENNFDGTNVTIEVELRSVNNRFLDLNWRLPQIYARCEQQFSPLVRDLAKRGRIEIVVSRKVENQSKNTVVFQQAAFESSVAAIRKAIDQAGLEPQIISDSIARLFERREILDITGTDSTLSEEQLKKECDAVGSTLASALNEFQKMREREGDALSRLLFEHLSEFQTLLQALRTQANGQSEELQKKLRERIEKLLANVPNGGAVDEQRLTQELVYLADRSDISEELGRLESHLTQLEQAIKIGEGAKKVEFLLQEIGREVNTSGSKSQRAEITSVVVAMKVTLEKMREQIQNLE